MYKKSISILFLFGLLVGPLSAIELAITDSRVTTESRVIEDDYLFLGQALIFDGQAEDLYLAGTSVTVNGRALGGITAFGETVRINGSIGNDAVLGGNRVQVDGSIEGTAFVGASNFVLSRQAEINGDLFLGSADAVLTGTVTGDIKVGSGNLVIAGTVNGNVDAGVGSVAFAEGGRINGNFHYYSRKELAEADRGRISGTITYERRDAGSMKLWGILFSVAVYLSLLILGVLLLLLPVFKNLPYRSSHKAFWFSALWGLIPFLLYPVIVILFMVLVVTIPLGFILLLAGIPVLVFTQVIGIKFTGDYLFGLFGWDNENRFLRFLLGFVPFVLLCLIPVVKFFSIALFSSLGWGLIVVEAFKRRPPADYS